MGKDEQAHIAHDLTASPLHSSLGQGDAGPMATVCSNSRRGRFGAAQAYRVGRARWLHRVSSSKPRRQSG